MVILLFEYVTGGGMAAEPLPAALAAEGACMVGALRRELAGTVEILRLQDARLPAFPPLTGETVLPVTGAADFEAAWSRALAAATAVWPLAPETGGVLAAASAAVAAAGRRLLGSTPAAVRLTGDKYATFRRLEAAGVACVPTWRAGEDDIGVPPPWVVKPRDGVGCEGVRLVTGAPPSGPGLLVQPRVAGEALSLSAVFAAGQGICLSVNRQAVAVEDGAFRLRGCEVNALPLTPRWQALVDRIAAAVPGLWGYVGIDVVATAQGPLVVEINPRLTLSYAGLERALGAALAPRLVELAAGRTTLADIGRWRRCLGRGRAVWVAA